MKCLFAKCKKEVSVANGMDKALEVKVAKIDERAKMPTKGSIHAAGWDLYALEDMTIPFRKSMKIRTGIKVAIPNGYEGQVRSRSSLGKKGLILPHSIGTIDSDYRGNVGVVIFNHSDEDISVSRGDRVAQLILEQISTPVVEDVEGDLNDTQRGEGGFGSTNQ